MAKRLQLTIHEPCHENWEAMTPAEKGRFCGSCQKQVVDFTRMSDTQVAAFFKKPSTGSVCGRFMEDQLDRQIDIPKKRIPWIRYFFQFAIPAFLASSKGAAQNMPAGNKPPVHAQDTVTDRDILLRPVSATDLAPYRHRMGFTSILPDPVYTIQTGSGVKLAVRGKVVDEQGNPVPYASVVIKESGFGTEADSTGAFRVGKTLSKTEKTLVVSSAGFESKEVPAHTYNGKDPLWIQLTARDEELPEVTLVSYFNMRRTIVTGSVTSVTTCTINSTENRKEVLNSLDTKALPAANVYPNPIQAGAVVSIDCKGMGKGDYILSLYSMAGQLVFQQQKQVDEKAIILTIPVPLVAAGTYVLGITHKESGKKHSQKIIIR